MLPLRPGVGFKPQHFQDLVTDPGPVGWVEVHAENYMGAGGRPLAQLRELATHFPVSVHGVGLSLGGNDPLDPDHLLRLKRLCDALPAASFSEHLAWSTHGDIWMNALLPLPYDSQTLSQVASHIDQTQTFLGRKLLLENPASYLTFAESTWDEVDFLTELVRRTGCGLLLDVNNVMVSSVNLQFDAGDYLTRFPLAFVEEIHVAGHEQELDDQGVSVLIDTHSAPVADAVWRLVADVVRRAGPKPILIEWDNDVPDWPVMAAEAGHAARLLAAG